MATMLLNPADDFQFSCWHLSASLLFLWFLWHNILLILLWLIFLLHLCCFFGRIIDLYPCLITQLCLTLGLLCPWDFFRQEYWSELPFPSSRGSSWPRDQTCISCVSCTAGRFFTPMSHLRNDTTFFLFFSYLTFFAAPLLILLQDCQPLLSLYHLESLTLRFSLFAFKESQSSPWLQLLRLQTPMVRVASCNVWQHHTASYTNVQLPLNALPRTSRTIQSITQSFLLHLPNYYWVHLFLHYLCYHFLEHVSTLAPYSCSSHNLFKGQIW